MPSQAAVAQEGMTIPLVENRARQEETRVGFLWCHVVPLHAPGLAGEGSDRGSLEVASSPGKVGHKKSPGGP